MNFNIDLLDESEKIIYALRTLYSEYGFERYRMSKFEDYDLYSRNKDFLVSDAVITFTDTNGRLKALKPDVTLSIIKNNKDVPGDVKKLCYNENVYRTAKGGNSFREIMQTGLECIGDVDSGCISEVLMLAAKSLALVNRNFMLEISDLEILSAFVDAAKACDEAKKDLIKCFSEKNPHGISAVCEKYAVPDEKRDDLLKLLSLYGNPDEVVEELKMLCPKAGAKDELDTLISVISIFRDSDYRDNVIIDFSAVSDMNYYNGIIFRGFVAGVPQGVLSGGQYDRLMSKMGRTAKAIGFAVYLDNLHA